MFIKARPVFADISENEMHILVDFHAEVGSLVGTELHICAADFYRVYIHLWSSCRCNGQYPAHKD